MVNKNYNVALFNDTSFSGHVGCVLVIQNCKKLLNEHGINIVWRWPVGKDWRNFQTQLPKRGEVDAVIVNGEGTMHHSDVRPLVDSLADIAEMASCDLLVPSYLINTTLFANFPGIYNSLSKFRKIFVRDTISQNELSWYGIQSDVVPDLTFSFPFNRTNEKSRSGVCVVDSVQPNVNNKLRKLSKENGWEFQPIQPAKKPIFRPRSLVRPRRFLRQVGTWWSESTLQFSSPGAFARLLSSRRIVISGRYHAVILCLMTETPFVAIESNTPKISFLLQDCFSSNDRVIQPEAISKLERTKVESFTDWTEKEKDNLSAFKNSAQQKIQSMLSTIVEDLDGLC